MPREEDCIISLPTYRQYWVHTKPYGHDIVIWSDTGKVTIQCKWPDMERSNNNRVKRISEEPMPNYNKVKEKSFIKKIIKCKKAM
jgi:hypothetical protein